MAVTAEQVMPAESRCSFPDNPIPCLIPTLQRSGVTSSGAFVPVPAAISTQLHLRIV